MRLTQQQIAHIRQSVRDVAGTGARGWLFGSRVDDHARGGDIDLLLQLDSGVSEPAALACRVATRVSRGIHGRKVDVLRSAPNLTQLPIHTLAQAEGIEL